MRLLTFNVVAGDKLQHLINANDREGELQDHHPLLKVQMGQLKDHLEGWEESVGVNSTVETTTKLRILSSRELRRALVWQTYRQRVNIDDHEVQGHGEGHGSKQPEVAPWGHAHQRLVLRQASRREVITRVKRSHFKNTIYASSIR